MYFKNYFENIFKLKEFEKEVKQLERGRDHFLSKYNHKRQVQLNTLESNFKLQQNLHSQKHKKYRGEAPISSFKDHIQLRKFDMRKMKFTEDKTDDFQTLFDAAKKEKTSVVSKKKKYNEFKEFKLSKKFLQPPPMPVALYIAR